MAYKKQQTTRNKIIRAKLPQGITRPSRVIPGMKKCYKNGRECSICPWVKEGNTAKATASSYRLEIQSNLTCQSCNIIYLIECKKCYAQYVGETERTLQDRFAEHQGYVNRNIQSQATGAHFNLPGHSVTDMSVMAIIKIHDRHGPYRKEMERDTISKFNTFHIGINKNSGGK